MTVAVDFSPRFAWFSIGVAERRLEFGRIQASRSDRTTVAVGNAHGLRVFFWVGVAERRTTVKEGAVESKGS